jgi:hypothetical protein
MSALITSDIHSLLMSLGPIQRTVTKEPIPSTSDGSGV